MNIARKSLMQKAAPPTIAAMVGAGAAVFGTVAIVMASGILPVSLARLLGAAFLAGALVGILATLALPRGWGWTRVAVTPVVAFGVACFMFKGIADQGLLVAKRHAERMASLIEQYSMNTHKWPAELSEVAGVESIPGPAGPWLSYPQLHPPSIAGFSIGYENNPPRVWVARRRYGAVYDLRTKKWVRVVGR
jgi:hypothetical protein